MFAPAQAYEKLYKAGKAKAIGVSNYCVSCFECLVGAPGVTVVPCAPCLLLLAPLKTLIRACLPAASPCLPAASHSPQDSHPRRWHALAFSNKSSR